ncbi:DUF7661 family protein [Massilia oculi]|uniref:DUF7661 family protein n=1 Tax=Massilia oculi TaxID=945844 RepID=UPI0028A8B27F|nr:hypothetical protein [Massilia oculi]
MRFSIYGKFHIEVRREDEGWVAYRSESGKRARVDELVIPAELDARDIAIYLDDIFHEYAGFGERVELVEN